METGSHNRPLSVVSFSRCGAHPLPSASADRPGASTGGKATDGRQTNSGAPRASWHRTIFQRAACNPRIGGADLAPNGAPHQIIDIYLRDPFRLRIDGGRLHAAPETVVVGPQGSRRIQHCLWGEIHVFNILLQPAGLKRPLRLVRRLLVGHWPISHNICFADICCSSKAKMSALSKVEMSVSAPFWEFGGGHFDGHGGDEQARAEPS